MFKINQDLTLYGNNFIAVAVSNSTYMFQEFSINLNTFFMEYIVISQTFQFNVQ